MKTSVKFEQMAEMYRHFGKEYTTLDWSDAAKYAMYAYESKGGDRPVGNGYFEGKRLLDITVAMWLEDLTAHDRGEPRLLFSWELYMEYPKWFLDKCLPKRFHLSDREIGEVRKVLSDG